jgi:hypothetical protein
MAEPVLLVVLTQQGASNKNKNNWFDFFFPKDIKYEALHFEVFPICLLLHLF